MSAARMIDQVQDAELRILAGLAAKGAEPQQDGPFIGPAYVLNIESVHSFGAARMNITPAQLAAIRAILVS